MFLFNFTHWNAPQSRCRWDLYRFRPLVIYPRGRRAGVRAAPTAGCGPGGCGISLSPPGCRGSPGRLGAAGPAERGWDAPRPGEPGAALAAFPGRREGLARGGAWGGGGGGGPRRGRGGHPAPRGSRPAAEPALAGAGRGGGRTTPWSAVPCHAGGGGRPEGPGGGAGAGRRAPGPEGRGGGAAPAAPARPGRVPAPLSHSPRFSRSNHRTWPRCLNMQRIRHLRRWIGRKWPISI